MYAMLCMGDMGFTMAELVTLPVSDVNRIKFYTVAMVYTITVP